MFSLIFFIYFGVGLILGSLITWACTRCYYKKKIDSLNKKNKIDWMYEHQVHTTEL